MSSQANHDEAEPGHEPIDWRPDPSHETAVFWAIRTDGRSDVAEWQGTSGRAVDMVWIWARILAGSVVAPAGLVFSDVAIGDGLGRNWGLVTGVFVGGLDLGLARAGFWSSPWGVVAYCVLAGGALLCWQIFVSCLYDNCL